MCFRLKPAKSRDGVKILDADSILQLKIKSKPQNYIKRPAKNLGKNEGFFGDGRTETGNTGFLGLSSWFFIAKQGYR